MSAHAVAAVIACLRWREGGECGVHGFAEGRTALQGDLQVKFARRITIKERKGD
jgi:hypothetical protein